MSLLTSALVDALIWGVGLAALSLAPPVRKIIYRQTTLTWLAPPPVVRRPVVPPPRPIHIARSYVPQPKVHTLAPPPRPKVEFKPPVPAPVVKLAAPKFARPELAEIKELPAPPAPPREVKKVLGFDAAAEASKPATPKTAGPKLGEFGSASGVTASIVPNARPNVAKLGSFDADVGSGVGAARIGRPAGHTAGFSDASDASGGGTGTGHGGNGRGIRDAGFGGAVVGSVTPAGAGAGGAASPDTRPPIILYKPKPVYTDIARQKRIQGEVVLKVMLGAAGNIEILSVERTLGYGLDQAAEDAARLIRFRPALRNGRPVDMPVVLHITFSLAY
jgi:protein TonB